MGAREPATPHPASPVMPALTACLVALLLLTACGQPAAERALHAQATEAALAVVLANAESTRAAARLTLEWRPTDAPPTAPPTVPPTPAPLPTSTLIPARATPEFAQAVANNSANVRAGPGMAYPKVGQLTTGSAYKITGQNADGAWWQIELNGRAAWVIGALVTVSGNAEGVAVVEVSPPPTNPLPTAPPTVAPPAPAYRCFTPKLRFYTAHKGCCGEILGEVRDLAGRPFARGQIEVTVPNSNYRTLWPISANGDYSITALSSANPYMVRLVGNGIRSSGFDVRYNTNLERALVDFAETRCPGAAAPAQPTAAGVATLAGRVLDAAGRPVAGARVAAADKSAETAADGRFTLAGLTPGQVSVVVTRDGYDPYLSAVVLLPPGETRTAEFGLATSGSTAYPRDPMATNQVDPAGAPTAADAERLARLQGFRGAVAAISETTLTGEYLVNYQTTNGLAAAAAMLNHRAWQLVDASGGRWYIIRVCCNLAVARPAALIIPVQCVSQSYPVFRCTRRTTAYTCPAATCSVAADLPAGWQGRVIGCSGGCAWLRLEGCGGPAACWVLAADGEVSGELGPFKGQQAGAALPRYRWSQPVQVSENGQGGINQAMLPDGEGRMIAVWEEHTFGQGPEHAYGPVHYRVFDGSQWSDTLGIPGSENHGEQLAATLADGSIIVTASSALGEWAWFRWQGGRWTTLPEMTFRMDPNQGVADAIVADGGGGIHLAGYAARLWDGAAWRDTGRLGTVLWHGGVRDSAGRAHAFGADFAATSSRLAHWLWNGSAWTRVETVYEGSANPSAAISPDDTMHLAWRSTNLPVGASTGPGPHDEWVSYAYRGPTGWSAPQPVAAPVRLSGSGFITFVDIAAMPAGNVVIAYDLSSTEHRGTIQVVWGHDGAWSEPVIFTPPAGYDFAYPGVGVDRQGRIHVLWSSSGRMSVWYAMGTPE